MPPPFSEAFRATIKKAFEEGKDDKTIRLEYKVSDKKIKTMRRLWEGQGVVWVKARKLGSGRKPKIKSEQEEELRRYIEANPNAYIKDMTSFLAAKCDLHVDESTVWRSVQKNGWTKDRTKQPRLRDQQALWVQSPSGEGHDPHRRESNEKKARRARKAPEDRKTRPTATEKLLVRTRAWVKQYMSDPKFDGSHDYGHVERVANLAKHILRSEQALHPEILYDPQLLEMAALLHDIEDHKYKDMPSRAQNPLIIASVANQIESAQGLAPYKSPYADSQPQQQACQNTPLHISTPPQEPLEDVAAHAQSIDTPSSDTTTTANRPPFPWPSHVPFPEQSSQQQPTQLRNQQSTTSQSVSPNDPPRTEASNVTAGPKTLSQLLNTPLQTHMRSFGCPPWLIAILTNLLPKVSYSYSQEHPDEITATLVQHPELAILQDADRLDALGGIGIARAFAFGGARGKGLEDSLHHFEEKLVKLEEGMWTAEGRRIARERKRKLDVFRGWWDEEVQGADYVCGPEVEDGRMVHGQEDMEQGYAEGGYEGMQQYRPQERRFEGTEPAEQGDEPSMQLMGEMYGMRG